MFTYVYFHLILVQIQIDSAYLLKTEIAETSSDWIFDPIFISLKITFIYPKSLFIIDAV